MGAENLRADRDVLHGAAHARHGRELVGERGGDAHALGQQQVLGVVLADAVLDRLVACDDDGSACVALGRRGAAHAGGEQHAARGDEHRGEEEGDGRAGEGAAAAAESKEREAEHAHAPRWVMRSATASAVGASSAATTAPSARYRTRSAYAAASGSCVTITTVCPSASTTWRSRARMSTLVRVSRAPVGSSAKTTCGRVSRARAIATRCC